MGMIVPPLWARVESRWSAASAMVTPACPCIISLTIYYNTPKVVVRINWPLGVSEAKPAAIKWSLGQLHFKEELSSIRGPEVLYCAFFFYPFIINRLFDWQAITRQYLVTLEVLFPSSRCFTILVHFTSVKKNHYVNVLLNWSRLYPIGSVTQSNNDNTYTLLRRLWIDSILLYEGIFSWVFVYLVLWTGSYSQHYSWGKPSS